MGGGCLGKGKINFNNIFEVFQGKKSQNTAMMDYLCYYNHYYVSMSV